MKCLKRFFYPRHIALTHKNAYINQCKAYSNPSIQWLEYIKASKNVDVQHALNRGSQIWSFYVDGYYEINGDRIALEYLGCFWHGCDCRFNPSELNPVSKIPYGCSEDRLITIGYFAQELQSQSFYHVGLPMAKAKQNDPDVMAFMSNYDAPERWILDSLFGGRTNALKLYHKASEDDAFHMDFTSLIRSYRRVKHTRSVIRNHFKRFWTDRYVFRSY